MDPQAIHPLSDPVWSVHVANPCSLRPTAP
jgi:hypothetical protein